MLVTRDKFDAVLFDLDGVLTSTAAIHADAWKRMFDEYLASRSDDQRPFEVDDYRQYVDGRPRYEGVQAFLESRGIHLPAGGPNEPPNDKTIAGLGNRKDAMVKEAIAAGKVQPFEGSMKWVKQLREAGFKLAVVSSSRNAGPVLKAAMMDHLFDARVDGETLVEMNLRGKPEPDAFLKAAELLGVKPKRAVVVEDAMLGVQSGRAGGFGLVIGVDREGDASALRDAGADVIVRDLGELANEGAH